MINSNLFKDWFVACVKYHLATMQCVEPLNEEKLPKAKIFYFDF
jgi:hypothetical protein